MKIHHLLPVIIIASMVFNVVFIVISNGSQGQSTWVFPELGPAVLQDSFLNRAPVVETPYGIIGDVPGGYSLYSGSPLQGISSETLNESFSCGLVWELATPTIESKYVILAVLTTLIPVVIVIALGRRSHGSS